MDSKLLRAAFLLGDSPSFPGFVRLCSHCLMNTFFLFSLEKRTHQGRSCLTNAGVALETDMICLPWEVASINALYPWHNYRCKICYSWFFLMNEFLILSPTQITVLVSRKRDILACLASHPQSGVPMLARDWRRGWGRHLCCVMSAN